MCDIVFKTALVCASTKDIWFEGMTNKLH